MRSAASPIIFEGEVIGAVAINTDVTLRERVKRELECANAEFATANIALLEANAALKVTNETLRRANDLLEAFTQSVSHDLKEPVRAMGYYLGEAKESAIASGANEHIHAAIGAHGRLARQLTGLLELSRISTARVNRDNISIADIVEGEACRLYYQRVLEERGARLETDHARDLVHTTPALLGQALGNLILNAILHNTHASPLVRIRVEHPDDTHALIIVEDNGPGFPEGYLDGSGTRKLDWNAPTRGGFGLTIARAAIDRLDGKLKLGRSELGGARVSILLPRDGKPSPDAWL